MKVCIPITANKGLQSVAHGHFGSAPFFLVSDENTGTIRIINNKNSQHVHGACHPATALDGEHIDVVVVRGIGRRALERLQEIGIETYQSRSETAAEILEDLKAERLVKVTAQHACHGHGHH